MNSSASFLGECSPPHPCRYMVNEKSVTFILVLVIALTLRLSAFGEDKNPSSNCPDICTKTRQWLVASKGRYNENELSKKGIVSVNDGSAFFSCIQDHNSCGAQNCHYQVYLINLKENTCSLIVPESIGVGFGQIKLSPSDSYVALTTLYHFGGTCSTVFIPEVWDIKNRKKFQFNFEFYDSTKDLFSSVVNLEWKTDRVLEYTIEQRICPWEKTPEVIKIEKKIFKLPEQNSKEVK